MAVLLATVLGPSGRVSLNTTELVAEVGNDAPVTATDRSRALANNSPLLVEDPTDDRFVVLANRVDAPDFGCALHVSGDGGSSWLPANPVPKLPSGADKCYAPEVAFDGVGVLYYLFVGLANPGNEPMGAFLTTSDDRGQTFTEPIEVLGPLNFAVRMAIDPDMGRHGRIHLAWLHATSDPPLGGFGPPPNPILTAHSDDAGRTFSTPVQVSDVDRERVVAPALALGSDHSVYVSYYDLGRDVRDYQGLEGPTWEEPWALIVASSRDGGGRFTAGSVVDRSITPPGRIMLIFTMPPASLVAADGKACIAWTDARGGDPDVFARCSSDLGRSWSQAVRMNDDEVGNGVTQYLPRLSLSPQGRLDAVFYDRRRDSEKNVLNDVGFTFSTDDGRTFAPNVLLTQDNFESRIGQQYVGPAAENQVEFGARLGLLSRSSGVLAAWTDTRNSGRLLTTAQDVFTAEVQLVSDGDGAGPPGSTVAMRALAALLLTYASVGAARRHIRLRRARSRAESSAESEHAGSS